MLIFFSFVPKIKVHVVISFVSILHLYVYCFKIYSTSNLHCYTTRRFYAKKQNVYPYETALITISLITFYGLGNSLQETILELNKGMKNQLFHYY